MTVLVAVSGGADSVAMLRLFRALKTAGAGQLGVAHFNHRLREAESTGADTLVTACPACLMQFQQVRNQLRSRLKVLDVTELINSQIR